MNHAILNDQRDIIEIILWYLQSIPLILPNEEKDRFIFSLYQPPLNLAAKKGRTYIIGELLKFGADVNVVDRYGRTPLHHATELRRLDTIGELLLHPGIEVQAPDQNGFIALHIAVMKGHWSAVNCLLADSRVDVNCTDAHGNTPLWWSSWLGYDRIVERLLQNDNLDLNLEGGRSHLPSTPIYHAVEKSNYFIADLLLKKPSLNPNIRGPHGWTPLGFAARLGDVEMVNLLLKRGDTRINAVDEDEDNPLWLAASCGEAEVVKLFMRQGDRLNINCQNNIENETALSAAARFGELHIVELLLANEETDLNAVDRSDKAAIFHAALNGHHEIVHRLREDERFRCDLTVLATTASKEYSHNMWEFLDSP